MANDKRESRENTKEVSKTSLAIEILREEKRQTRHWKMAFMFAIALWVVTICGFFCLM